MIKRQKSPGLWLEEVPIPSIGPHEVLVRVLRTGICGTDLHIYDWDKWAQTTVPAPLIIGHEFVGVVEKVGAKVKNVSPGTLVSGEGHLVCNTCHNCRSNMKHLCPQTKVIGVHIPGAFAEYIAMPAENIWKHSPDTAIDVAAIFDPFGNAVHTASMFDLAEADVLVTGAGPIGIMAALVAQAKGARKVMITDVNEYRLSLARQAGVQTAINVSTSSLADVRQQYGIIDGFKVGFEMSGTTPALNDMISHSVPGGKIAALGLPAGTVQPDWSTIVTKMLTIKGVFGREMFATWQAMSQLLKDGLDIASVITHRFGFADFEKAFAAARSGDSGKVILNWETPQL
ncbi:MAG TPA: L-threonine 3-dehydrogenase [Verrucomicrobiae bacterium]|nr:L-threonine 3-dehydrogenase [Verrucomicrobiae bacterium]